jgi:hypothetical protein
VPADKNYDKTWNAFDALDTSHAAFDYPSASDDDLEEEHLNGPELGQTNAVTERRGIRGAGQPVRGAPQASSMKELHADLITHPFGPFNNGKEFTLARWFIEHQITKSAFDDFPRLDWIDASDIFDSFDQLRSKTDKLCPELGADSWMTGTIEFDAMSGSVTYYYRDPMAIIKHLLLQPAFANYWQFAPHKEFSSDGGRVYTEMHTADWWWDTQVCFILLQLVY